MGLRGTRQSSRAVEWVVGEIPDRVLRLWYGLEE